MDVALRRSVLYVPGSNTRALEKAADLPADAVILDLEDAVAPDNKIAARERVAAAVASGALRGREVVARVNPLDTPWGDDDVAAMAELPLDAVLFPKVSCADDVIDAAAALDEAGAPRDTVLWTMVETARALVSLPEITTASSRLRVLVMGTSDLARELRVPALPGRPGLTPHLAHGVAAARAAGLDILDGVHTDLEDTAGFQHVCQEGRALGFDGKTVIHPNQIETANRCFGPDADAVARAHRIVAAWEEAAAQGRGIAVVDGRMIERLHAEEARRVLALDQAIRERSAGGDG